MFEVTKNGTSELGCVRDMSTAISIYLGEIDSLDVEMEVIFRYQEAEENKSLYSFKIDFSHTYCVKNGCDFEQMLKDTLKPIVESYFNGESSEIIDETIENIINVIIAFLEEEEISY